MRVVYARCCGLDVHKKSISACLLTPDNQGGTQQQVRRFGTMTRDLLELSDWAGVQPGHTRSHGEHRRVWEAGVECLGSNLHHSAGERPTRESGSRAKDRCKGLRMAGRSLATRIIER